MTLVLGGAIGGVRRAMLDPHQRCGLARLPLQVRELPALHARADMILRRQVCDHLDQRALAIPDLERLAELPIAYPVRIRLFDALYQDEGAIGRNHWRCDEESGGADRHLRSVANVYRVQLRSAVVLEAGIVVGVLGEIFPIPLPRVIGCRLMHRRASGDGGRRRLRAPFRQYQWRDDMMVVRRPRHINDVLFVDLPIAFAQRRIHSRLFEMPHAAAPGIDHPEIDPRTPIAG